MLEDTLQTYFGYGEFRPQQRDAVEAATEGRDVLVVMPTGAGKSLCFQLPAALSEGVTLVVSPLIALMRDQVDALNRRPEFAKIGCACLTSLQSPEEQYDLIRKMRQGHLKLVYVAPERFRSGAFMDALKSVTIARFVVDEAHCISEWGHDFRPDYLSLREVVETLGNPPLLAATATATRRVQQSIVANLGMRDPLVLVGGFNRPNLHFSVHRCKSEQEREDRLARALPKLSAMGGSGLIYVATRKQCEQIFELAGDALAKVGQTAGIYHAGLDAETRTQMQREWLDGERQVLVATNAFGMGIDKPDVRFVVHCACPDSLESYYQEAGRAGRDGLKSRCVILYHFADRRTREWFIDNEALTAPDVERAFGQIRRFADEEKDGSPPENLGHGPGLERDERPSRARRIGAGRLDQACRSDRRRRGADPRPDGFPPGRPPADRRRPCQAAGRAAAPPGRDRGLLQDPTLPPPDGAGLLRRPAGAAPDFVLLRQLRPAAPAGVRIGRASAADPYARRD